MRKIVGIVVLSLMTSMVYSAEPLALESLNSPHMNIDSLDEGSINRLFTSGFTCNEVGYNAFLRLSQRRRTRMAPVMSSSLVSSAEGEGVVAESNGGEKQATTSDLELVLPVMEIRSIDLCGEFTVDEKRNALRVVRSAQVAAEQSSALDKLLGNVRSMYNVARESEGVRQGMVLAGAGLLVSSYTASQNRSIFASVGGGTLSMLPEVIGGAGSALMLFWVYEKYIGVMEGVRLMNKMQKEIGGWVRESKKIAKEFASLKLSYNELKHAMNAAMSVTDELKDKIPAVVALSEDHNTLAGIMQMLLQKAKADEKKIASLQQYLLVLAQNGNLPNDVQELLKKDGGAVADKVLPMTEEEQKEEIVKMYNKPSGLGKLLGKKPKLAVYEDIPQEWFVKHADHLAKAGLFIRP